MYIFQGDPPLDKVDHPVFFLVMKRLFIVFFVIAGMAAVLGVSASAAGTITASLNEPLIDYTYTDDPDDPFESFSAYASYAGRSEQFWTSEDPDLLMIPNMYLLSGMHFYIEGSTALGSSVRSNIVTYLPGVVLPDIGLSVRSGWDCLEWDELQLSSSVDLVYLCIYRNNSQLGRYVVYSNTNGYYRPDFAVFSLICATGALPSLSSGDYITFVFEAFNSANVLIGTGRNFNYQYVNPYEVMQFTYDNFLFRSAVPATPFGLAFTDLYSGLTYATPELKYIDDQSSLGGGFSSDVPPVLSMPFSFNVFNTLRSEGNLLTGGAVKRSFAFRLRVRISSGNNNYYFYSPWHNVNGLDGLGGYSLYDDPVLYHPTNSEIESNVALIYRGVSQTKAYRYAFSGLSLCVPFMVGVFLIKKVH